MNRSFFHPYPSEVQPGRLLIGCLPHIILFVTTIRLRTLTAPHCIEDIFDNLCELGEDIGRLAKAEEFVAFTREHLQRAVEGSPSCAPPPSDQSAHIAPGQNKTASLTDLRLQIVV